MRIAQKYVFYSLFCGILLFSSAAYSQNDLVFPEIDGWEKGDVTTYPTPELGYSIPYSSDEGGVITIYVYNGGNQKIADGIGDSLVKAEIKKAESDIRAYGEAGYYAEVKLLKSESIALNKTTGKMALYSLFTFKVRGNLVYSEIYLFGHKNQFIKIRATRRNDGGVVENESVSQLLVEISEMFE